MDLLRILATVQGRSAGAVERLRGRLSGAIGRVFGRGPSRVLSRVASLWRNNIVAVETLGQTLDRQDNWYQWRLGMTERHCRDCSRLNGQIHRASEWRAAGIRPQSFQLECKGFNCDCRLVLMPGYEGQGEGRIDYWIGSD